MRRFVRGLLALAAICGLGGFVWLNSMLPDHVWDWLPGGDVYLVREELPAEEILAHPHITREAVLHDRRLGLVTDIRLFPAAIEGRKVGFAGRYGVLLTGKDFSPSEYTRLSIAGWRARFAGVCDAEFARIVDRGAWTGARVYGKDGSALWHPPSEHGINSVVAADFLGNGTLQYAVGYNGRGGVSFFDEDFNQLWNEPDRNVWDVAAAPIWGQEAPVVVHTNVRGELVLRDLEGQVLVRALPEGCPGRFSMCRWPEHDSPEHVVYLGGDQLWVYTPEGEFAASMSAPVGGDVGEVFATPVRLKPGAGEHFAALVRLRDRSALFVYDESGSLIFHELLGSPTIAIAAEPDGIGKRENLLIGGQAMVWRYRYDAPISAVDENDMEA